MCSGLPIFCLTCSLDASSKRVALCEYFSGMYGVLHSSFALYLSTSCTTTCSLCHLNCPLIGVHVLTILSPCSACLHAAVKACLRNATTSDCAVRHAFCISQSHVSICRGLARTRTLLPPLPKPCLGGVWCGITLWCKHGPCDTDVLT